jgi:hypothetical protein
MEDTLSYPAPFGFSDSNTAVVGTLKRRPATSLLLTRV